MQTPTGSRVSPAAAAPNGGIDYRSLDYSGWSPRQRFYKRAIAGLFRLLAPVDILQEIENIPKTGPVLLAVNHLSMLDIPVLLTILPRRGVCVATERMRKYPWVRWFLKIGDTIWVRRGKADQDALLKGLMVLRAGGLLGLAPKGTRGRRKEEEEEEEAARPGAHPGQSPAAAAHPRSRPCEEPCITVAPGEKTAARLQHETERLMTALAEMLPPEYRGVYDGEIGGPRLTIRRGQSR